MLSSATTVPAASDLLCAQCGYVLSGLPKESRCPECGTPIAASDPALRHLPEWERQPGSLVAFFRTTAAVIFRPARFFLTFATRVDRRKSQWFAGIHMLIASLLFGFAASKHLEYVEESAGNWQLWVLPAVAILCFFLLVGLNWLVGRLTHWEATYRGLRLPIETVRRVMDYHTAHYLPVAGIAALTVWIFVTLSNTGKLSPRETIDYFYVLSGEVIVAATYLFKQYWTAMRNVMYANA